MYFAKNENGALVSAYEQQSNRLPAFCPDCEKPVIGKRGDIIVHHWAHTSGISRCPESRHRSKIHDLAKVMLYNELLRRGLKPKIECRVTGKDGRYRVADIYVEHKGRVIAFEIQKSDISNDELQERIAFYGSNDIEQCWIPLIEDKNYQPGTKLCGLAWMLHELQNGSIRLAFDAIRMAFVQFRFDGGSIRIGETMPLENIQFDPPRHSSIKTQVIVGHKQITSGHASAARMLRDLGWVLFGQNWSRRSTSFSAFNAHINKFPIHDIYSRVYEVYSSRIEKVDPDLFFHLYRSICSSPLAGNYEDLHYNDYNLNLRLDEVYYRLALAHGFANEYPAAKDKVNYAAVQKLAVLFNLPTHKSATRQPVYENKVIIPPSFHTALNLKEA